MSYELCLSLLGQHRLQARVGRELKAPGRHVKRPSVLCSDPGPPPAPLFALATEPDMAGLAFGHPWKNQLSLQLDWASLDGSPFCHQPPHYLSPTQDMTAQAR